MTDCCDNSACEIERLRGRQLTTLKVVFFINAVMFFVEMAAGVLTGSVSLVADSLDMFGDALAYGLSLFVVRRTVRWKARSALVKGAIMASFGLVVLIQSLYKVIFPHTPMFEAMGLLGLAALAANATSLALLWRHRADDINMHSVWMCSRNDIVANFSVIFTAAGVWAFKAGWPDVLVGVALSAFVFRSAILVIGRALSQLRSEGQGRALRG